MGIVIRPSPAVFRRAMPLVIVFGAYRRFDIDPPLAARDRDTITRVVRLARRLHMPLAFIRNVPENRQHEPGAWLPGCRPTTMDRVFDLPAGTDFRLEGFAGAFCGLTDREIYATGPQDDSPMSAAIAAGMGELRRIRRISPALPLHNCSTLRGNSDHIYTPRCHSGDAADISLESWEHAVCSVQ